MPACGYAVLELHAYAVLELLTASRGVPWSASLLPGPSTLFFDQVHPVQAEEPSPGFDGAQDDSKESVESQGRGEADQHAGCAGLATAL